MKELHIDIETYSSRDINKGVDQYVNSPDFEIMLCAYAFDDGEVFLVDLTAGESIPQVVKHDIFAGDRMCFAHNASFETTCFTKHFGLETEINYVRWRCTAVMAAELGLPRSLGQLTRVIKMPVDKQKDKIGKSLINYFCKPCKPTKVNGGRTRNLPHHAPEKWELFKEYCRQDVIAEREVHRRLKQVVIHPKEWEYWRQDQRINRLGARVDLDLVKNAVQVLADLKKDMKQKMKELTGLDNPNSVAQIKPWIEGRLGREIPDTTADTIKELIATSDDELLVKVLTMRRSSSRSSLSKYKALADAVSPDGRIHGTLLFYGAIRTGRWAGRVFQPQNLPQNHLKEIEHDRWMLKHCEYDMMNLIYEDVADTMVQLIRTCIIPSEGKKFIVADFSAVEARCLAWLAGEQWRLDVFKTHGKIYEASAAAAFHVPIEEVTKGSPLRAQGKVLELACGYGGSKGAIAAMDHNNAIPENERKPLVDKWRAASPNIVNFWWKMGNAAMKAVRNPGERYEVSHGIRFYRQQGFLFMDLPSGRRLAYPRPMIQPGKYGDQVTYEGINQQNRKWERQNTYGPKLVENLVQATCRDLLAYGMERVEEAGYDIVMHVHDEAVVEVPMGTKVETIEKLLALKPDWALGMPHVADGFETAFYKKD